MFNMSGNNWDKLTASSSSTTSSSSSSHSWSGLRGKARQYAMRPFGLLSGLTTNLANQVINAQPNQNVLNNLANLNSLATQNWIRNYRPAVNTVFNQTITGLANRGVLDSSVAGKALSGISGNYMTNLANLQTQLEMDRISKALNYLLTAFNAIGGLGVNYGNLLRESEANSRSSSTSTSTSYNPSPAVGLLSRLMGI